MKTEFESKDIEAIAQRVTELVRPLLSYVRRDEEKDHIFDVKGLAEYLHVNSSWIYKQIPLEPSHTLKRGNIPDSRKKMLIDGSRTTQ